MIRRIRGWRPAAGRSAPAPAPSHTVPGTPGPAALTSAPGGAPASEPGPRIGDDVERHRSALGSRLAELERAWGVERGGDVPLLLAELARPGNVVRRPPAAAQEVLALSRRAYGLDEMAALFEQDPAMSQGLLRHANSAWYAGRSAAGLSSIKAAVQRVGTKGVNATVMFHLLQGEVSRPGSGWDGYVQRVWEHMIRVAPLARGIAARLGGDPDDAFTLGLLHDVGKLIFFDRVAVERKRLRRDLHLSHGFVSSALTALHEPLGAAAAVEWGMDPRSAAIIGSHHRRGDHPSDDPLSEAVFLAEAVDVAYARGEEPDLQLLWTLGEISGTPARVGAWLAEETAARPERERAERRRRALRR